jgi:hypothetical protein
MSEMLQHSAHHFCRGGPCRNSGIGIKQRQNVPSLAALRALGLFRVIHRVLFSGLTREWTKSVVARAVVMDLATHWQYENFKLVRAIATGALNTLQAGRGRSGMDRWSTLRNDIAKGHERVTSYV